MLDRDLCTTHLFVTPAKAGVQKVLKRLDTGFRRYDDWVNFKRNSKLSDHGFEQREGTDDIVAVIRVNILTPS